MDCCWGHWWRCCHDNQRLKTKQILACILWNICTIKIYLMHVFNTISILDLWRFHIGSNILLIWIFSIKNFLFYFFSRLVDITSVLSLTVIKPLSEDNLVYVNSLTFIFNHGFDFPHLYKVTIKRQSVFLWTLLHIFKSWVNE